MGIAQAELTRQAHGITAVHAKKVRLESVVVFMVPASYPKTERISAKTDDEAGQLIVARQRTRAYIFRRDEYLLEADL
jgi:hypothetical protein